MPQTNNKQPSVLKAAQEWYSADYSVGPPVKVDGSKAPITNWKQYQATRATKEQMAAWYKPPKVPSGLFVVLGYHNLACLDFESPEIYKEFCAACDAAGLGDVLGRVAAGYLERSPGGYHLLFRCAQVGKKLVPAAKDPAKVAKGGKLPLIEYLGEGEGVVVAPSAGKVHPSGKPYVLAQGGPKSIAELTVEEQDDLLAVARTLDQRPPPKPVAPSQPQQVNGSRPGDEFNTRGPSWDELLTEAGWQQSTARAPEGETYWTRRGKDPQYVSASVNYKGSDLFYVFTTSTTFEAGRSYDKFGAYTFLNHEGDWSNAAGTLAQLGYGKKSKGKGKKQTQAEILMEIAKERWELTWWAEGDGEPFAIERDGPNIALPLRGNNSARAALSAAYAEQEGKPPNSGSLADVMLALEGMARKTEPRALPLRIARPDPQTIYVDLGDVAGRCVEITPGQWRILLRSPITFRRTRATQPLPDPLLDGSLRPLKTFLRTKEEDWPLMVAWLVHTFLPEIPHAILALNGPENSGKSQTSKRLCAVVDPSAGSLSGPPKDKENWVAHAIASWIVGLENISHIEPWMSDGLCRAATGDAQRNRKYYTNADVDIQAFMRPLIINGISFGVLRSDLTRRMLPAELLEREDDEFEEEEVLEKQWRDAYGEIVGGLYWTVAEVLSALPDVEIGRQRRLPDFARVLVAVDKVLGTNGFTRFRTHEAQLASEVVEGDLVAQCLQRLMVGKDEWEGSATILLRNLNAEVQMMYTGARVPSDMRVWPQNGRGLASWLRRLAPALRKATPFKITEHERVSHHQPKNWRIERDKEKQAQWQAEAEAAQHKEG